jgi:hypothetical protein
VEIAMKSELAVALLLSGSLVYPAFWDIGTGYGMRVKSLSPEE